MNPERVEKLAHLALSRMTRTEISKEFGVSERTIFNWLGTKEVKNKMKQLERASFFELRKQERQFLKETKKAREQVKELIYDYILECSEASKRIKDFLDGTEFESLDHCEKITRIQGIAGKNIQTCVELLGYAGDQPDDAKIVINFNDVPLNNYKNDIIDVEAN